NFSIGVNVFWGLLAEAAKRLDDYDIEIIEAHHNQKKDAPSGTAMKAAEVISNTLGGKELVYGRHGIAPRHKEIGIHAVRGGDIVGDHTVLFAGDGERIEIKHQAHSRQAFAKGAVTAALWVSKAQPGIYEMADVLGIK
ncbi:MAG: 4-hydroxy-tetrahydrodipicolinate reductase, partial [Candidatus Methanoperedens sp.]|nr:4-hydroxy-tetrahydrodipicolinate reductase [Candidatus Methanoperedens sp.]